MTPSSDGLWKLQRLTLGNYLTYPHTSRGSRVWQGQLPVTMDPRMKMVQFNCDEVRPVRVNI